MTKRQLIDEIATINRSAKPSFLAKFDDIELDEYLQHLRLARTPQLSGDPHRFDHYFDACPTIAVSAVATETDVPLADEAALPIKAEQQQEEDPPTTLDLDVSPSAYFKESYEAKAS